MGRLRSACAVIGCLALLLSCARPRSSAPGASADPVLRDGSAAGPEPSAAASSGVASAPAHEGGGFPRAGLEFAALLPAAVGFGEPGRFVLVADAGVGLEGGSLPFVASLARRTPALRVLVIDRGHDARLRAWLLAQHFVLVEPTLSLTTALDTFEREPPFATYRGRSTSPWPSMAASDGVVSDEPEQVYLFHETRLLWIGSGSNLRFVLEHAVRGTWTLERLREYENIRGELDRYGELALSGDYEGARRVAEAVLATANAQPTRLADLAQAMGSGLDSKAHVELALALARRAERDTDGLDESILGGVALAHLLAGDGKGAVSAARQALELCRTMKSDCGGQERVLERAKKCPLVLVETPAALRQSKPRYPRYSGAPAPGAPADCR